MIEGFDVAEKHWPVCEALLLRSAVAEPKILRVLLDIYDRPGFTPDLEKVEQAIVAICTEHGRLQHGNEVLWALWAARTLDIHLGADIGSIVSAVDDDLVALTALHLADEGRISGLDTALWRQCMSKDNLYSHHWLLAYEASVKGWLAQPKGRDFTLVDDFFKVLRAHDVSFYDIAAEDSDGESEYSADASDDDGALDADENDDDGTETDFENLLS
jgi:hypothetical protein